MLVICIVYVIQFVNNICLVFVVPDICCSKNPTTCLYVVCSTLGPMSSPDTVSIVTVYNGIIEVWVSRSCFNCVITERLQDGTIPTAGQYPARRSRTPRN